MNSANLCVTIDSIDQSYPFGTPLSVIVRDQQSRYAHDILLVEQNGRLMELHKPLTRGGTLRMVTALDKPGMQTYERSAVFLLLRAFRDVAGPVRIRVEYALSRALFLRVCGAVPDQALLNRVQARMQELVRQKLPIEKRSLHTEDAVALFSQAGMEDKARLLSFRITSQVNVYYLQDFFDYFYGYMVPDTGYLGCFGLEPFADGFVLRLPDPQNPRFLAPFCPSIKVFDALRASDCRGEALQITDVGQLNTAVSLGRAAQTILAQEAVMEKEIGDIAEEIARRKDVRFVMIAGPSSSGKTTFSHRLSTQLTACGLRPHPIATDNYFKNREDTPRDETGQYDFECLGAMDTDLFNADMTRLLNGETVELPTFNFKKGRREYTGEALTLGEQDILVIEGIHCLNDSFSHTLPPESKFKIYISCLTTLNVDDHNRISTTDARLLRRIARDARTRGFSAQATIAMWPSVRRGEERNIFPYQDSADRVFNSALIYETALLRPYVEPLLYRIPRTSPEYPEAKRLLKFLSYVLAIPADEVPRTSLIREFTGGGYYQ